MVNVNDKATVHQRRECILAKVSHRARIATFAIGVQRSNAAHSFKQHFGERIAATAGYSGRHVGTRFTHRGFVLWEVATLGGFPESTGVQKVQEVDDVATENTGTAQGTVDVVKRVHMARTQRPQFVDFGVNLCLVTFADFAATGQHGDATVEHLRHFNTQYHGQFAFIGHLARFGRGFHNSVPTFARAAKLRIHIVLHVIQVFHLFGGNAHVVAIGFRFACVGLTHSAQGGNVGAVVDHYTQTCAPCPFNPGVVHHLVGQEVAARPVYKCGPTLCVVLGARCGFQNVVGIAYAVGSVKSLATAQRMRNTKAVHYLAIQHAACGGANTAIQRHFAGHAHVGVSVSKTNDGLIFATAFVGCALHGSGHFGIGGAVAGGGQFELCTFGLFSACG